MIFGAFSDAYGKNTIKHAITGQFPSTTFSKPITQDNFNMNFTCKFACHLCQKIYKNIPPSY